MTMPDCPVCETAVAAKAPFHSRPSFGFYCRSSGEVARVLETARGLENGCIVIGRQRRRRFGPVDPIFALEDTVFTEAGVPVVVWPEHRLVKLDGFFDVIVFQAPFAPSGEIRESRIVTIPAGGDCRAIVESSMNSISGK